MERVVCLGESLAIRAVEASMLNAGFVTKTAKIEHCRPLIEQFRPDVVVVNLGGVADLDVLRGVRRLCASTAIVAIGAATVPLVIEAMRLGACDFIDANQATQKIVEALRRVAGRKDRVGAADSAGSAGFEPHAAKRIAEAVVRMQSSPRDPRTIQQWGRYIGVSAGGLRNWCRTAQVLPRRALLFARILRAVALQDVLHDTPENLLDIVDRRTLTRLLAISGGTKTSLPANLEEFLRRQELIQDRHLVEEVQRLLAARRPASFPTARPPAPSGMAVVGGSPSEPIRRMSR